MPEKNQKGILRRLIPNRLRLKTPILEVEWGGVRKKGIGSRNRAGKAGGLDVGKKAAPTSRSVVREKTKVRVDDHGPYKLKLSAGERITGTVSSDGQFSIFFFRESGFRTFDKGGEAREIDGSYDVSYIEPSFTADRDGYYYVVIQNEDRKNIQVDVDLRVTRESMT